MSLGKPSCDWRLPGSFVTRDPWSLSRSSEYFQAFKVSSATNCLVLLAVSLMVKAGTASWAITEDAEVLASLRAASE